MNNKIIHMTIRRKEKYHPYQQENFLNGLVYAGIVNNMEKKGESKSNKDGENWNISTYDMVVEDESTVQWIKYIFDLSKPYLNFTVEIEEL